MKCAIIPTGRRAAALYPPTTSSPTASAAGYAVGQAGQRHEAGLGLYDYHARYYDPLIGRFISADTLVPSPGDPQSLNRYAYVQNNPLKYTDPSGYIPEVIYDKTWNIYRVKLDVQIYGSGASAELAQEWEDHLNSVWNAGDYQYEEHAVVFEITVTYKEPEFTIWGKILNGLSLEGMAQPKSGDAPNLIFIAEGPITAYRPFVEPHTSSGKDFDWGSWFSGMGNGYAFHESAHLFGIYEDRYDEYTENPLPGYENYVTADGKGSYVQKPAPEEVREIIDLAVDRGQFTEEGNPLSLPAR